MKTLLITLTVLLSLFNTKTYASDVKVTSVVLHSFESSFENAKEVKWSITRNMYKADFEFNTQYYSAYFDSNGDMIATTRNITSLQLPINLQKTLKKDYQNLWITELFEVSDNMGTSYYVTLENGDTKLVLNSIAGINWSTYQKQRKS